MNNDRRGVDIAESLIEVALALLDRQSGEERAACLLQHALDTLKRVPAMQPGDELDPAMLARFGLLDAGAETDVQTN